MILMLNFKLLLPFPFSVPSYFVSLSKHTNIFTDVLYALTAQQETNTKINHNGMSLWPYTINLKNRDYRESMVTVGNLLIRKATVHFIFGPFQINWK